VKVVTTRAELGVARRRLGTLGFVPTMGYLHEGHVSLVRRAKAECDAAAASIFVNPKQFGPGEDLARYPRDLDRDLAFLEQAGCDLVWTPGVDDVYPDGFATTVDVHGVADVLEGARRPGHFQGVATVVTILMNAVHADRVYFGQKDAQQSMVIRRLVTDLALPGDVVISPTVREPDGLAMSSRNTYLDPRQRVAATALWRALSAALDAWAGGETSGVTLRATMAAVLAAEPLAEVDYVSIADRDTLTELTTADPARGALASMAVRFGRTRLIDNVILPAR
jgi:pantoate--beta-alanine ligase